MLELVAQSVAQRAAAGTARTGAHDLLSEFQLRPFYNLSMKGVDRNYLTISTKEVPTGLPGDTSLFAHPSWSLLRPPPLPPPPSEPTERVVERVRRGLRFPPGGAVLSPAAKGAEVTRVFMRNVPTPPPATAAAAAAARPPGTAAGGGGGGSGSGISGGFGAGGKRRATADPSVSSDGQQQVSGDTGVSHESKRARGRY
ncbi:hypothetical protein Agub_g15429 [Astrephomene gubernaculifera]|uniref:Uncharacterized protein n=1 Tax=Astrephomene gubernaculifera TaxID=47775 RepID=A0AAD3HTZ0_9CHLO|nr:hypothetical protein Agub_g15429 [Astrephomene gubernaculifera]